MRNTIRKGSRTAGGHAYQMRCWKGVWWAVLSALVAISQGVYLMLEQRDNFLKLIYEPHELDWVLCARSAAP